MMVGYALIGQVALARGNWQQAIAALRQSDKLLQAFDRKFGSAFMPHRSEPSPSSKGGTVPYGFLPFNTRHYEVLPGLIHHLLGQALLAVGHQKPAVTHFKRGVQALIKGYSGANTAHLLLPLLGGLERSLEDRDAYRCWCDHFREIHPWTNPLLIHWYMTPVTVQTNNTIPLRSDDFTSMSNDWVWNDPFGGCTYTTDAGLTIRAVNARYLWHMALSAPRLLQPLPSNVADPAIQINCEPAMDDRPAIGGLLLWKSKEDYLWLEMGRYGTRDAAFGGCLKNRDLVIGRGRLPEGSEPGWAVGEPVTLRLEISGDQVDALCSLNGEQWFSVGHATFPFDETVKVGVHAIGLIDRSIYHGAYPEGTAIRFTGFKLWKT